MAMQRWNEIDVLYAIGILLVILGHSHSSDWSTFKNTPLEYIILFIYSFHMALFFAISGFLFHNSDSLPRVGYRRWFSDKALRLLIPYLFWSLIALVSKYYVENHSLKGLDLRYLMTVIFFPRQNVWGHFWFLPVLFICYAVLGSVHAIRFTKCSSVKLLICELAVALLLYFRPLHTNFLGLDDWSRFVLFFVVGEVSNHLLQERNTKETKQKTPIYGLFFIVPLMMALLLYQMASGIIVTPLIIALLMLLACWLLASSIQIHPILGFLSSHNYTFYIFAWFFQCAVMYFCERLHYGWVATSLAMLIAGVIGPMAIVFSYKHLPFMHSRPMQLIFGFKQ